jgi:hypothetical protein
MSKLHFGGFCFIKLQIYSNLTKYFGVICCYFWIVIAIISSSLSHFADIERNIKIKIRYKPRPLFFILRAIDLNCFRKSGEEALADITFCSTFAIAP